MQSLRNSYLSYKCSRSVFTSRRWMLVYLFRKNTGLTAPSTILCNTGLQVVPLHWISSGKFTVFWFWIGANFINLLACWLVYAGFPQRIQYFITIKYFTLQTMRHCRIIYVIGILVQTFVTNILIHLFANEVVSQQH